jgi:hypothetical protein
MASGVNLVELVADERERKERKRKRRHAGRCMLSNILKIYIQTK